MQMYRGIHVKVRVSGSLQAPMGLFYPTTFGIVGQKMTSLPYRSQGDPEDPHDEHYLLGTQSKQDQVQHTHTQTHTSLYLDGVFATDSN